MGRGDRTTSIVRGPVRLQGAPPTRELPTGPGLLSLPTSLSRVVRCHGVFPEASGSRVGRDVTGGGTGTLSRTGETRGIGVGCSRKTPGPKGSDRSRPSRVRFGRVPPVFEAKEKKRTHGDRTLGDHGLRVDPTTVGEGRSSQTTTRTVSLRSSTG